MPDVRARLVGLVALGIAAAAAASGSASAPTLPQLPKLVADVVRDAERECRADHGEPTYELAQMVRTYFMGAVGKGRETYVVTFDEFECIPLEFLRAGV